MKLILSLFFVLVCVVSFFAFQSFKRKNVVAKMVVKSVYEFAMKDIDGNAVSLSKYKGKVLVFVNVASKCGYTPQYESIEKFYELYKDKGVVVLGFPANNFFAQEPGTDEEIKSFCTSKYNVTFPMFSKISVKGDDMNPLYQFLTKKELNGVTDNSVKWNFHKIIVDKNGKVVTEFASKTKPTDESFLKTIDELLK
ncbi:MAG: putative glutathione peroxidase BsaA [Bacteroidota bacterium]|jgi:glutathione peroxidase